MLLLSPNVPIWRPFAHNWEDNYAHMDIIRHCYVCSSLPNFQFEKLIAGKKRVKTCPRGAAGTKLASTKPTQLAASHNIYHLQFLHIGKTFRCFQFIENRCYFTTLFSTADKSNLIARFTLFFIVSVLYKRMSAVNNIY